MNISQGSLKSVGFRVSALMGVKESTVRHLLSQLLLIGLKERGKGERQKET